MEENKKLNKVFKYIFLTLFITYITLYIANINGYYNERKLTTLTQEQIAQFEKDIKEGNDVRINEYLKENQKKYNNKTSDLGYNFSKTVSKSLSKGIKELFDYLNKFVDD